MRRRSVITLILACGLALEGSASPTEAPGHIGRFVWRSDDPRIGGMSGLEISDDGLRFTALSDRGGWTSGRLLRDGSGRITGIEATPVQPLRGKGKEPLAAGRNDSEGLAIAQDGTAYVSFEGVARVLRYARMGAGAENLPTPPAFAKMQRNSSLEALAIGPDGTLYTLPERSGREDRPFPVWRFRNGGWDQALRNITLTEQLRRKRIHRKCHHEQRYAAVGQQCTHQHNHRDGVTTPENVDGGGNDGARKTR